MKLKKISFIFMLCVFLFVGICSPLKVSGGVDIKNGERLYKKHCAWCHGLDGGADGVAADFILPKPRDFIEGDYKFRSTSFDEIAPSDEDFFQAIKGGYNSNHIPGWKGMNNTAMPAWGNVLKDLEIKDVIAFIKELGGYEPSGKEEISYSKSVNSSAESLRKGKKIFKDLCSECHGKDGKGNAEKKLKDDFGYRTWARNLTKPWTFRAGSTAADIYTRVTVGIGGTQMPSFADPYSKKKLSKTERWHVANYVVSLGDFSKLPSDKNLIKVLKIEGKLPSSPDSPLWKDAEFTNFFMIPQLMAKERLFTPSIDSISVKAINNKTEIAFLLEWDDYTKSVPGEKTSIDIAGIEVEVDGVSIQLPLMVKPKVKPNIAMGDEKNPVSIWHWKSENKDGLQSTALFNARGYQNIKERKASEVSLKSSGFYDHGTWQVIITRALNTKIPETDLQFKENQFIPVAFGAWDGSNQDSGSKHVLTSWGYLILKGNSGNGGIGIYLWPLVVGLIVFLTLLMIVLSYRKK